MKPAFILTGDTFTGVINGKPFTINRAHSKFEAVTKAWRDKDYKKLTILVDGIRAIENFTLGNVTVKKGSLSYKGEPVSNQLGERVFQLMEAGADYLPLMRFLDNLMQNPLQSARDELFLFLEKGHMPITEDGYFLAYRYVNNDYTSCNANPDGTHNSNKPGEIVKMDRNKCDSNRHETCSRGLHFCSFSYLPSYGDGCWSGNKRVMIVKVNPMNVVAIPSDHDDAKGRCCEYEVLCEHERGEDSLAGALAIVKEEAEGAQTVMGKAKKFIKAIIGKWKN